VSNVLNEEKQKQVVALGRLGWTLRRIERTTGVRRETAAVYLKAAGIAVREPGGWGKKPAEQSKPANGVTTDSPPSEPPKPAHEATTEPAPLKPDTTASACEPYRELIEEACSRGRNAMAIWQDLNDRHGFTGAYESVKRFVRRLRGTPPVEACAVIETEPGQEAQVDYGSGPMVRDADTGKYRRTRLFVMTLGYSRKCVRLLTFQSSSQIWCELHEIAFRRLGGVCKIIVLDNLGEGVLKPDIYDPAINPLYRDLLTHYGAVAMPCRVRDPDRKGKVESGVGHAKKTPLKGMRFENGIAEGQTYLDRWEERWADTRIHGTTKRQVATMFAEEKPHLQILPLEPFRYYQHGVRTVHLDGCVEVDAAYYSVPPGYIGWRVRVQWDGKQVRILHPQTGQLLREHLHQQRGRHRIADADRSPRTPPGVLKLLGRARTAGKQIGAFCEALHAHQGELAVRRIQGVLSLARKYSIACAEHACAAALELEIYDYRFVRRCLEREATVAVSLKQIDPLIRELTLYRDVIAQRTKEEEPTHESH
jgi:transposase